MMPQRDRRGLGWLLAAAAIIVASLAPARGATAPPSLAGTTTIVGSSTAIMKVRAPVDLTLSGSNVDVQGAGRFAGVVLWKAPAVVLKIVKFNMCFSGPGCAPHNPRLSFYHERPGQADDESPFDEATLPAGDYQLYFFADGAPVTVRLGLGGVGGSITLQPSSPLPVTILTPKPSPPATDPATFYYSAGATHEFGGSVGVALHALHFDSTLPGPVETLYGTCAYDGNPPPGRVFGPGCPSVGSKDTFATYFVYGEPPSTTRYSGSMYGTYFFTPGRWTVGDFYVNAWPTNKGNVLLVFFNFDTSYTP